MRGKNRVSPGRSGASSEDVLCQKAVAQMNAGALQNALAGFEAIIAKNPDHYLARINKGACLSQIGAHQEAAKHFYSLHESHPDDPLVHKFCGMSCCSVGAFEMAMKFLQRYTKVKPDDYDAWATLASAAGRSEQYTAAVMYATKALSLEPLKADAYNNLGATLLGMSRLNDAEQAFETALALDAENVKALSNLAAVAEKRGDYDASIRCYESVLTKITLGSQHANEVMYRSSYAYLGAGQLLEGWRRYDYGFKPKDHGSRFPKRTFTVPQWDGEPMPDKRLLIWGEQGLGDELWFFGLLTEAKALCPNITVECQPRLVSLLQRSFPDITVRATDLKQMIAIQDYDCHIPAGSLMGIFRNHIDDLKKFQPYIKPDPNLAADFASRLQPFKGKKLVGICWRSGKVDAQRIQHYLALSEFSDVLKRTDCVFVNLQYGECESELQQLEADCGVHVLRWHDVDLKDNQEQVAALIGQLDVVVSAGTAVAEMVIAVGVPLIMFGLGGWRFLGQENYPWYDQGTYIRPAGPTNTLADVLPRVQSELDGVLSAVPSSMVIDL
jgi:tetratricopeptide (TPR) repeat protein